MQAVVTDQGPKYISDELGRIVHARFLEFLTIVNKPRENPANTFGSASFDNLPRTIDYAAQLRHLCEKEKMTLFVDFKDISQFDDELAQAIVDHYVRFFPFLREALSDFINLQFPDFACDSERNPRPFYVGILNLPTVLSVRELIHSRNVGKLVAVTGSITRSSEIQPELLSAAFECRQCNFVTNNIDMYFQFQSPSICPACKKPTQWRLITDSAVTNISFLDDVTSVVTKPLEKSAVDDLVNNLGGTGDSGVSSMNSRIWRGKRAAYCQYGDFQKYKISELTTKVPIGESPRTMTAIFRNELIDSVGTGDSVVISGVLMTISQVNHCTFLNSYGSLGGGNLAFGFVFLAAGVSYPNEPTDATVFRLLSNVNDDDVVDDEEEDTFKASHSNSNFANRISHQCNIPLGVLSEFIPSSSNYYDDEIFELRAKDGKSFVKKLIESICPQVFGHYETKFGILLMLLGGVGKTTDEGMVIRGDLNICLVGDPATAKSQFLKFVYEFLNSSHSDFHSTSGKCVYTSGQSASAAGLTAALVKDVDDDDDDDDDRRNRSLNFSSGSNDFVIEPGALMLADRGICCLDEFDKLNPVDQTALHEAMEQQSLSLSKAGIHVNLKARCSVLAAANPTYGRYDVKKSLQLNLSMISQAIMSRFDLFFVIVDGVDEQVDFKIACHMIDTKRRACDEQHYPDDATTAATDDDGQMNHYSTLVLSSFIRMAKQIIPVISSSAEVELCTCYQYLRQHDLLGKHKSSYRITVRQLESLIRLSEAIARLHLDPVVRPMYVREAFSLLSKSIIHVQTNDVILKESDDDDGGGAGIKRSIEAENDDDESDDDGKHVSKRSRTVVEEPTQDSSSAAAVVPEPTPQVSKSIPYEEYRRIASLIIYKIKQMNGRGVELNDLVNWSLEQLNQGEEKKNDDGVGYTADIIRRIVQRLIHKDGILIHLEQDNVIQLHPNADEI